MRLKKAIGEQKACVACRSSQARRSPNARRSACQAGRSTAAQAMPTAPMRLNSAPGERCEHLHADRDKRGLPGVRSRPQPKS